ncbi:MAG: type II toxin-antitoxin system RelE/ParE family toxin [Gammaproteobacteria bacterium]|nr:type II toxin-antitoxin system RelE/ParE family toxin [Gammaproteobacteria bacterium]
MYDLFETDEFSKSLGKLQKRDRTMLQNKLKEYVYPQINSEPHFGVNIKKLRDYSPNTWRYRIGSYRIFYTIDENDRLILLLVVESRDKAYRKN